MIWRATVAMAVILVLLIAAFDARAAAQEPSAIEVTSIADSCLGSTGRVDITLQNVSAVSASAVVGIDLVVRPLTLAAGTSQTVTITGRNDGLRSIEIDGEAVAEVLFRCGGGYSDDDMIESATPLFFSDTNGDGVGERTGVSLDRGDRSVQPGEPGDCVFGLGTSWKRAVAPGPSVEVDLSAATFGAAIYVGPVEFTDFEGLARVSCIEPGSQATIETDFGAIIWVQVSGPDNSHGNLQGRMYVTAQVDAQFIIDVSTECQGANGIIEVSVMNGTDLDLNLPVVVRQRSASSEVGRALIVASGATEAVRVSGRSDGAYEVSVGSLLTGTRAFVDCIANTGRNDTVAAATELSLEGGYVTIREPEGLIYRHDPEELVDPGCFEIRDRGSAWYSFVATDEVVQFQGDDDASVSLWRSEMVSPTTLAEMEALSCSDAQSGKTARVVPGQRYWVALTGQIYRDLSIETGPAPVNDRFDQARPLSAADVVPGLEASVEPGEISACGGVAGPSLWWTWKADADDVESLLAMAVPHVIEGTRAYDRSSQVTIGIFSSEVDSPTIDQLDPVGCVSEFADPPAIVAGRSYWLAVYGRNAESIAISSIPLPVTAGEPRVICDARGTAQFDWLVTNDSPVEVSYELVLRSEDRSPPIVKRGLLPAGSTERVAISARPDGSYLWTLRASTVLEPPASSIRTIVDCNDRETPVDVENSCLGGAGRIDVFIDVVPDLPGRNFAVTFTGPSTRLSRTVHPEAGAPRRVTVTGRRNGEWSITVAPTNPLGEPVFTGTVTVEC